MKEKPRPPRQEPPLQRGGASAQLHREDGKADERALVQLQRLVGNAAVSDALAARRTQGCIFTGESHDPLGAVEHPLPATGLDAHPAVQRAGPTAPTAPLKLDEITVVTYSDGAAAYRKWCSDLTDEMAVLTQGKLTVPPQLADVRKRGLENASSLEGGEEEPLDQNLADDLRAWHVEYSNAIGASRRAQAFVAADRARAAAAELREANAKLEALVPMLRDVQRAKFRGGDEDGLLETADAIATIVDTALVTKSTIEDLLNFSAEVRVLGGMPSASKAAMAGGVMRTLEVVEKLNKAWAAFQLVRAAVDLVSGSKTEMEGASKGVAAMATIMSAGGTLLNASAGFTLYSNLYIGPMTSACLKMLSRLEDLISKSTNRAWIELGKFEYVNWSLEPGGRKMFDFMLRIMRANSPSEVPGPTGDVDDYFVDNQDDFNAGVGKAGGDLPTEGMWFWEDTNSAKFKH